MDVPLSLLLVTPAAALAGAGLYLLSCQHPRSTVWGPAIHRGPADGGRRVALTFDDGPTPGTTDAILDELKQFGVKATFFVIGSNAAGHPDLIRRIDREGHLLGNHSFEHSHFGSFRGDDYWERELRRTSDLIEELVGYRPEYFRPPMGVRTHHISRVAKSNGLTVVTWSRRGIDGLKTTPARLIRRLAGPTAAGDIVILHDGVEPNARRTQLATVAAVGPLIQAWRARGLELVRLDELLAPTKEIPIPALASTPRACSLQ